MGLFTGFLNVFRKKDQQVVVKPVAKVDPIKYRPDLAVLRLTTMKSVLIECAYVNNRNDIKT